MIRNKVEFSWGYMIWLLDSDNSIKPDMSVAKMILNPGAVSENHFHNNCYEFLILEEGTTILDVSGKKYEMKAGQTKLIPPNSFHKLTNKGIKEATLTLIYSKRDRNYSTI
jgi:mannose-6-phosphate isomerase-like protein (cupin superfamily)